MHVVVVGHVDHGKSTIVGRLLVDTGSLPEGKLEQVKAACERNSKPFEYAFLLDALRDEQAQGITIDAARVFFRSANRYYVIIDAPGHVEFVKNMVTGAARAQAALLVIDANEGMQENSRRHGYLLAMLGIGQVVVLVNKMDLVDYAEAVFERCRRDCQEFLAHVGIRPSHFIPVCGREGQNIARAGRIMPWYTGPTTLEALDTFVTEPAPVDKPFRMPVQDVYKFTKHGDDRRIVAGTVEAGSVRVGDEVVFYPSGKRSHVKTIEAFPRPGREAAVAGEGTGFTLGEQIFVTRGEVATLASQPRPKISSRLRASVFWLGQKPFSMKRDYVLKLGTARAVARLEEIVRVTDAASLESSQKKARVDRHDVAECVLKLDRAIAFDLAEDTATTSRFVIVDEFEIRGGGIVREALADRQESLREKVMLRNYKWEPSIISIERRAGRYSQIPTLVLVTGERDVDRKAVAKGLEAQLFDEGRVVYFLGIGSVLYGVDADIERKAENRREHLRRLAEVANIMLDAGVILIVAAAELTQDDLELIKTTVEADRIETVWVGDRVTTDLEYDLRITDEEPREDAIGRVHGLLRDRGIVFRLK